jgi:Spy/CpxP family protein refolding chaperone
MVAWTALKNRWGAVAPRRKAWLALLLVFVVGIAAGALIEEIADEIDRPLFSAASHNHDDDDFSEEDLLGDLSLSREQRASVERVFESREDRLESYWEAQLPELETLIDSSRDEIRAILTPEQRAIYESQLTRLRSGSRHPLGEDDDE